MDHFQKNHNLPNILKKWDIPDLFFIYFRSFQTNYRIKTVDFTGIQTQIVGVEGERADHLTT